jgi:lysophospholipase L1-like esterase
MLLVSVVWIFIMGECLLRILPLSTTKEVLEQSFAYEPSAFCMYRLATRDHDILNPDGKIRAIQRNGYKGEAFPFQKDVDEIRIVIMGGSFVFDPYVDFQKDFPYLLEKRLKEKGFSNVRIINGGVPGHRTSDSMGRLLNEVHLLEPDYVVLCHAWNDIKYFRNLTPEHNLLRRIKSLNRSSHEHYPPSTITNIMENSQIILRIKTLPSFFSKTRFGAEGRIPEGEISDKYTYWALRQYKLNIATFVDACRNFGVKPILFTQPRLVALENTEEDKKRIDYHYPLLTHKALCRAFSDCDSIIKSVAEEKNAEYFDFATSFIGKREYWVDYIHFNNEGSSKAADVLLGFFEKKLKEGNLYETE